MLLVDDLLLAPWRGLLFVFSEIAKAVEAEREAERRGLMSELAALHRRLDEGRITEREFEAGEGLLLDRLDALAGGEDDAGDDRRD